MAPFSRIGKGEARDVPAAGGGGFCFSRRVRAVFRNHDPSSDPSFDKPASEPTGTVSHPLKRKKPLNTTMKLHYLLVAAGLAILPACERHETPEVKEKVDDALDRRPNEGLKDAGEDLKDAAKDAGDEVKDAGKEIKEEVKDATR
jgi:hypothetical protein